MRILLIGPCHPGGSIPPYLDVLAAALRRCGARVHRIGSAGVPYEPAARAFWPADRILEHASGLLRDTDIGAYDVISLHFGNLEIEQLLPVLWAGRRRAPVGARWKYARARRYLAVSQFVKNVLIQGGVPEDKISVVYDGVPLL